MELPVFSGDPDSQTTLESATLVVLPAPLEQTVSYGGGTARGPAALLAASAQVELIDEETAEPYWAPGSLHTLPAVELPADPGEAVVAIAEAALPVVEADQFLLTLGGEHTVTAGSFRAVSARHPGVGLLVFDAHLDLRDQYENSPWSHACVVRRIIAEHGTPTQWCATRSACQEEFDFLAEHDLQPFFAHHLDPQRHWIETLIERLPERVYLSIDVDGLDPSVMPGTGTPEPGGLDYRSLLALIRELFARRRVVAADIVELAPIPGQHVSEFTAAKIATKILGSAWRARGDA